MLFPEACLGGELSMKLVSEQYGSALLETNYAKSRFRRQHCRSYIIVALFVVKRVRKADEHVVDVLDSKSRNISPYTSPQRRSQFSLIPSISPMTIISRKVILMSITKAIMEKPRQPLYLITVLSHSQAKILSQEMVDIDRWSFPWKAILTATLQLSEYPICTFSFQLIWYYKAVLFLFRKSGIV